MVTIGETDKLPLAPIPIPTKVEYVLSEYHFQLAPVPKLPPVWVSVVEPPLQIAKPEEFKPDGATEG